MEYTLDTLPRHKEQELLGKIEKEYQSGFHHIQGKIEDKKKVLKKLLPKVNEGELRVHLLWKNLNLENSIFVTDELTTTVVSEDGVLADEYTNNANKVFKFDYEYNDLYENREEIVNYNGLYGLGCNAILEYDEDEQSPTATSIHPLMIIPDPHNWRGSKMRFIGITRRVALDSVKQNDKYKTDDLYTITSAEYDKLKNSNDSNLGYNCIIDTDGLIDLYDHFTTFDGHKYLVTLVGDRSKIIRLVSIEPMTKAEKNKPNKVKFPVVLYRRKPIPDSFYGASIADEVLQEQDAMSLILNLMTIQANIQALGPDKYFDSSLGIDTNKIARMGMPGGRQFPVTLQAGKSIREHFYQDDNVASQNFPLQMLDTLKNFSNDTMARGDLAFGQSASGSQTKAEVNTLMENINQQLGYISQNYMRAEKDFWELWYKSYASNMSETSVKNIVLFESGKPLNRRLRKSEFVVNGKYQVYITSKSQERVQSEKDFNKLIALQGVLLPNITDQSGKNNFLRFLSKKINIDGFHPLDFIVETQDEIKAKNNLELLNNNKRVDGPQAGEDLKTIVDIYRKNALDTEATREVIDLYDIAIMNEQKPQQIQGIADKTTQGIAMNNINQQQNTNPSLANIGI